MERRTPEKLQQHLDSQVGYLVASCEMFDAGNQDEAARIAVVIRILVHQTPRSHSLLDQLGLKNKMLFLDSSLPIDPQPAGELRDGRKIMQFHALPGLVGILFNRQSGRYVPALRLRPGAKGLVSFPEWWESPILPGEDNHRFSRRDLVLQMANKEGGAHIDREIDQRYEKLRKSQMIGRVIIGGVKAGFTNSVADVSMRQIGWEILQSLPNAGRWSDRNIA